MYDWQCCESKEGIKDSYTQNKSEKQKGYPEGKEGIKVDTDMVNFWKLTKLTVKWPINLTNKTRMNETKGENDGIERVSEPNDSLLWNWKKHEKLRIWKMNGDKKIIITNNKILTT